MSGMAPRIICCRTTTLTGIVRLDYQINDKHRLGARRTWVNAIGPTRDRLKAGNADTINHSHSAVIRLNSTLSPRTYNHRCDLRRPLGRPPASGPIAQPDHSCRGTGPHRPGHSSLLSSVSGQLRYEMPADPVPSPRGVL